MYFPTYLLMYLSIYLSTYIHTYIFIYLSHQSLPAQSLETISFTFKWRLANCSQTQKSVLLCLQRLILCANFISLRHVASKIFLNMSENTSRKGKSEFELVWGKKIHLHQCEQPSSNHTRTQIEQEGIGIENSLFLINKTTKLTTTKMQ